MSEWPEMSSRHDTLRQQRTRRRMFVDDFGKGRHFSRRRAGHTGDCHLEVWRSIRGIGSVLHPGVASTEVVLSRRPKRYGWSSTLFRDELTGNSHRSPPEAQDYRQSTATARAEQISVMRASLSRPIRLISTPTEMLSTAHPGQNGAAAALLARTRAFAIDASYRSYDEHQIDEPDEWGDLSSFRSADAAS